MTQETKDWVTGMFPGDGLAIPSDEERDRADALLKRWNEQWSEPHVPIPRVHPVTSDEGFANYLSGMPTNRAYLRSKIRRWWLAPDRVGVLPS